jgi:hypothetical protein
MDSQTRKPVFWKRELVGYIENPETDMWYVDGIWRVKDNEAAIEFVNVASQQSWDDFQNIQNVNDFIWVGVDANRPNYIFAAFVGEFIRLRAVIDVDPPESW